MEKQAKKKGLSIAGIALCLVLLCGVVGFVVYAAVYQSFDMGGKVSFEADGVNATVEATGWTNCTIGGEEYSDEQTILPKIVYSTDKGLVDTSGVSAWEDLDVVITDSPATLTFKVTNDSSDTALDVEIGTITYKNESTNEIKIESDVESETVEAGESLSITITFTVSDTSYGAEISDFNIPVTLTNSSSTATSSLTVLQDDVGYYVEMGYFPQTYIAFEDTDCLTFVSSQAEYAENTYVEDESGNYYQCELIKWDVLGIYTAGATMKQTETTELTEYTGQTLEDGQQLVLQSRYGLEYVVWDSDYEDSSTVYEGSDIDTWLETFYTNILATNYSSNIITRTIDYNTTASHSSLEDGYENYIDRNVWLLSYDEATTWYGEDDDARIMYATAYCLGDMVSSNGYWWLRSSFYDRDLAAYVLAGYVGPDDGYISYTVVSGGYCVCPAMLITL